MTATPHRRSAPDAAPDDAQSLADLVGKANWIVLSSGDMTDAGVDPTIARLFFANFADAESIPLSELAVHITRRHADWRPAAIKTTHHLLHRAALVPQPHDPQRCGYCQSVIARPPVEPK